MSTVGSLLRATQSWCQQLCSKETLDFGIAFYCPAHPELPELNQFREVVVDPPASMPAALAQAEAFFAEHGLRCARWAPAMNQNPDVLAGPLVGQGFRPARSTAWSLRHWPQPAAPGDVRVLPARAMRAAFRATFPQGRAVDRARIEAEEARLDDPPYDVFVAVRDGRPLGRCALYQVGDIARVMDLHTTADDRAAADAMLAHVLAMAHRLAMRTVVAELDEAHAVHAPRFTASGFVEDGVIVEFERAAPPSR